MTLYGAHNIGKVLEIKLKEVGIENLEDLKKVGTEEAFLRLYSKNKNTSRAILFSIEGAIAGVRWHNIDKNRKNELEKFFKSVTQGKNI